MSLAHFNLILSIAFFALFNPNQKFLNQGSNKNQSFSYLRLTEMLNSDSFLLSLGIEPGASPIKILKRKFYAMLIFKHLDWLINLSSQSECLKNA